MICPSGKISERRVTMSSPSPARSFFSRSREPAVDNPGPGDQLAAHEVEVKLFKRVRGEPADGQHGGERDEKVGREELPEQPPLFHELLLETVTDAADGLDVSAQRAELLAEPGDLHVDRTLGDWVVFALHG